jgi:hypothetical protein
VSDRCTVVRGTLLAYRVYDTGDMIALDSAERLLPEATRRAIGGPLVEGLVIAVRPLEISLGECELVIPGIDRPLQASVSARVFEFGAVSVLFQIPIVAGTTIDELTPLCDVLYESPVLDAEGFRHRESTVKQLGPCIEKAHGWSEAESYTIVFLEEVSGGTVETLCRSEAVAKLLIGEPHPKALSRAVRDDVLGNAFSYFADDLVIVDWNSAFVLEPSGSRVVPQVLELATCQLLEFRYYDGMLEHELERLYSQVERAPRVLKSPFGALRRQALRRFMGFTEFTERVDNALKSVGDVYLARVYLAAIRRFRVPDWRESVETKLRLVGRAYELLKGEVEASRNQLLELTVVLLILVEIVAAFRRH